MIGIAYSAVVLGAGMLRQEHMMEYRALVGVRGTNGLLMLARLLGLCVGAL